MNSTKILVATISLCISALVSTAQGATETFIFEGVVEGVSTRNTLGMPSVPIPDGDVFLSNGDPLRIEYSPLFSGIGTPRLSINLGGRTFIREGAGLDLRFLLDIDNTITVNNTEDTLTGFETIFQGNFGDGGVNDGLLTVFNFGIVRDDITANDLSQPIVSLENFVTILKDPANQTSFGLFSFIGVDSGKFSEFSGTIDFKRIRGPGFDTGAEVPLPAAAPLFLAALGAMGLYRKRSKYDA